MKTPTWREQAWKSLETPFDVVVVGGGITGAGILHEAARRGLRALLVDKGDFASGTSSRSSKLVHGGLRYLAQGDLRLTWASVRERDNLLAELPGLVEPIGFLMASYEGDRMGRRMLGMGLRLYDLFSRGVRHRNLSMADLQMLAPRLQLDRFSGGFWYRDAQTDDARLVLRVLFEALEAGGHALSYVRAEDVILEGGKVVGVALRDSETGAVARVSARAVINATGAWADGLRSQVDGAPAIRPLRGSHLLFPSWRFPVAQAVAFRHPTDRRPLFAYPWEGMTLLGTTDLDHSLSLEADPEPTAAEATYMVEAARGAFPGLSLKVGDAVSSYAGVRPVVGTGKKDPSKESREHVLWDEKGLITVTGGKLTTFRTVARHAVKALEQHLPGLARARPGHSHFTPEALVPAAGGLDAVDRRRLAGRHGPRAAQVISGAAEGELLRIPGTYFLWAELRHAARTERVVHLEDLLLRRLRVGLLLPEGGREHLPRVRDICQAELGWDDGRWQSEELRYLATWHRQHKAVQPPAAETVIVPPRASAPRPPPRAGA